MPSPIPFLGVCLTLIFFASLTPAQDTAQSSNPSEVSKAFTFPRESIHAAPSGTGLPVLPPIVEFGSLSNISTINSYTSNIAPNDTAAGLKPPAVVCDPEKGEGLSINSCRQAFSVMTSYLRTLGAARSKVTIGARSEGIWDIPDRVRFLSSE